MEGGTLGKSRSGTLGMQINWERAGHLLVHCLHMCVDTSTLDCVTPILTVSSLGDVRAQRALKRITLHMPPSTHSGGTVAQHSALHCFLPTTSRQPEDLSLSTKRTQTVSSCQDVR